MKCGHYTANEKVVNVDGVSRKMVELFDSKETVSFIDDIIPIFIRENLLLDNATFCRIQSTICNALKVQQAKGIYFIAVPVLEQALLGGVAEITDFEYRKMIIPTAIFDVSVEARE